MVEVQLNISQLALISSVWNVYFAVADTDLNRVFYLFYFFLPQIVTTSLPYNVSPKYVTGDLRVSTSFVFVVCAFAN